MKWITSLTTTGSARPVGRLTTRFPSRCPRHDIEQPDVRQTDASGLTVESREHLALRLHVMLNRERDRDHIVSRRTALISGDPPVVAHVAGGTQRSCSTALSGRSRCKPLREWSLVHVVVGASGREQLHPFH